MEPSSTHSFHFRLEESPEKDSKTRAIFEIPIPSHFYDDSVATEHSSDKDDVLKHKFDFILRNPIFCQGSSFQLYHELDKQHSSIDISKKVPPPSSKEKESNNNDHCGINYDYEYVYTDYYSPKPNDTAIAIGIRLQKRFLDFCNDESLEDDMMKEGCSIT